jgi:hypothetical protein
MIPRARLLNGKPQQVGVGRGAQADVDHLRAAVDGVIDALRQREGGGLAERIQHADRQHPGVGRHARDQPRHHRAVPALRAGAGVGQVVVVVQKVVPARRDAPRKERVRQVDARVDHRDHHVAPGRHLQPVGHADQPRRGVVDERRVAGRQEERLRRAAGVHVLTEEVQVGVQHARVKVKGLLQRLLVGVQRQQQLVDAAPRDHAQRLRPILRVERADVRPRRKAHQRLARHKVVAPAQRGRARQQRHHARQQQARARKGGHPFRAHAHAPVSVSPAQ